MPVSPQTNRNSADHQHQHQHQYQHDQWISEVRNENLGHSLPDDPAGDGICRVDGYLMLNPLL